MPRRNGRVNKAPNPENAFTVEAPTLAMPEPTAFPALATPEPTGFATLATPEPTGFATLATPEPTAFPALATPEPTVVGHPVRWSGDGSNTSALGTVYPLCHRATFNDCRILSGDQISVVNVTRSLPGVDSADRNGITVRVAQSNETSGVSLGASAATRYSCGGGGGSGIPAGSGRSASVVSVHALRGTVGRTEKARSTTTGGNAASTVMVAARRITQPPSEVHEPRRLVVTFRSSDPSRLR